MSLSSYNQPMITIKLVTLSGTSDKQVRVGTTIAEFKASNSLSNSQLLFNGQTVSDTEVFAAEDNGITVHVSASKRNG